MDFLKEIINVSGNKFASKVEDGLDGSDVCGYIDTGSYTFNALLSGSLFDGLPSNKITCLAGESATGKTYFSIGVVAQFLAANPEGIVLYFDTEQAVTSDMFTERGVDPKRIAVFPVETVEEFRHQCLTIVDKVLATDESERKPMMIVLDSLGMLSTSKEMNDVAEGKNVRDMTRAQVIKGTFRVLTLKLGKAKIPMLMINHTYDVVGCLSDTVSVLMEDGTSKPISEIVIGDKVKTLGGTSTVTELFSDSGLNRYYGLVDLALDYGIFKKNSTKIELPDGTKAFEKHINEEPEKYFTQEILKQIDERVQEDFKYG